MPKYRVRSGEFDHGIETPFPAKPREIVIMAFLSDQKKVKKAGGLTEVSGGQYKGENTMYLATDSVLEDMGMMEPTLCSDGASREEVIQAMNEEIDLLTAERDHLLKVIDFIGMSDTGGEIYPVGPDSTEYAEDGNTVVRYLPPWHFLNGVGDTFLAAVEDAMEKMLEKGKA